MVGTSDAQRLRLQLVAAEFLERMGRRMRERREELGYSRAEVARRMPGKTNENQVYRWEKGLHSPNVDTLEALAKVLDCEVAYFMTEPPDKTETPNLFAVNGDGDRLIEIDKKLDALLDHVSRLEAQMVIRDAEVLKQIEALAKTTPVSQPARKR